MNNLSNSKSKMDDINLVLWSVRSYVAEVIQSFKEIHLKLIFCFILLLIFCIGASFSGNSYQVIF